MAALLSNKLEQFSMHAVLGSRLSVSVVFTSSSTEAC